MKKLRLVLFTLFFGASLAVDLHLDGTDAGFFFQQSLGSSQQPLLKFPSHSASNESKPLLRERLAVLGPSAHPGRIIVTYGPFEAKQSLPAKYLAVQLDNVTETEATLMDITAHLVSNELRRESPVLRVLFHSGRHFHTPGNDDKTSDDWEDEPRLLETCIALKVTNPNGVLTATCAPQGLDGVCLASLTIPFDWWASSPISPTFPSLQPSATIKPSKAVKSMVELSYAVYETKSGQCFDNKRAIINFPPSTAVLVQPARPIGSVKLLPNVYAPRDLLVHEEAVSLSPTLRFIASAAPLYPHSYFYVTVLLDSTTAKEEPYAVVVRAKVKNGLKIISTQTTNPAWTLSFDVNGKHIAAAVTAVRNFSVSTQPHQSSQELFTWLLSVNVEHHRDSSEIGDGVRALWSWTIRSHSSSPPPSAGHKDGLDEVKGKLTSRFEVLKDEVQSVFPIIKRRDLVNTAILTSRQVSEPLRVFMVTQAGKVADVTLQASCSSADESVLKVSSSCTSVYLDGSEVRGSTNATLVARYGSVESTSSLTVWVPEMPLDIQLDDVKLNQISGWKVAGTASGQCRLRYQQTSFEVFARFYAEDHDSGRVSYLISRKTYLLITDLVRKVMRVADPRIAMLKSGLIEGIKPGKTELQVLSPMSGHVIAAREVRVAAEKADVTSLSVRVIAGLTLNLTPDADLESCFIAQVDATDRLHSRYQEAIFDLTVHLSDGTAMPLRLVDRSHYNLAVESHNSSILALTSPVRANIPRVLALGEGRAIITVTLSSACNQEEPAIQTHPLAATSSIVHVSLSGSPATSVQNDARTESSSNSYTIGSNQIEKMRKSAQRTAQPLNQGQLTFSKPVSTEFGVHENQLSLKDDSNAVMISGRADTHPFYPGYTGQAGIGHMSPLEIGMYVLLAIFCAAIVVFVGTCVVYASRARKGLVPVEDVPAEGPSLWNRLTSKKEEDGIAEEENEDEDKGWIWLGRSTLDPDVPRTSTDVVEDPNGNGPPPSNRLSGISYAGSEVSVRIVGKPTGDRGRLSYKAQLCFEKESLGSSSVDSSTFTKNSPLRITDNQLADEQDSLLLANVVRRPKGNGGRAARRSSEQDTRRYARSWLMAGEAVPRDFNSNSSSLNGVPEPEEDDNNTATEGTFLRHGSPDIKQANIIENPRFSADLENCNVEDAAAPDNEEKQTTSLNVDYDRIISYLGILKETST